MGSFSHKKIAANIDDYPVTPWRDCSPPEARFPVRNFNRLIIRSLTPQPAAGVRSLLRFKPEYDLVSAVLPLLQFLLHTARVSAG
jgi:hypothetical protein